MAYRRSMLNRLTRFWIAARREAGLSALLAIQVVIIFVLAPFAATGAVSPAVVELARVVLGAVAVLTVNRSRPFMVITVVTLAATILLPFGFHSGVALSLVRIAFTVAFDLVVAVAVARVAFAAGRVTVHRIMGGVILYLSVGLVFAEIYRVAALTLNPSFTGLPERGRSALSQLLYFSFSTLTTTGFGDIAPLHPFVRSLSNLEAVIGQLYPATLLARLVTLHSTKTEVGRAED